MQNAWYIVCTSEELADCMLLRTVLSQEIVLYRDSQKIPHALTNQCPHRGARLSDGKITDDKVACPFHGWQFAGDGKCQYIPANGPETKIPPSVRVYSYPLIETAGYIWIYIGQGNKREDLIVPPELLDPTWKKVHFQTKWNAHLTRVVESILDVSHLPFVHPETTGDDVNPMVEGPEFYVRENVIEIIAKPYHPLVRTPLNEADSNRPSIITFTFPNQIILRTDLFNSNQIMATYLSFTPIDDDQIVLYGLAIRNFFTDFEMIDQVHYDHNVRVLEQDRPIVEGLRPKCSPLDLLKEQHVRSDSPQIRYRLMVKKRLRETDQ